MHWFCYEVVFCSRISFYSRKNSIHLTFKGISIRRIYMLHNFFIDYRKHNNMQIQSVQFLSLR